MLSKRLFLIGQKKDCRAERTGPPAEAAWMLLHLLLNRSYPTACRKQALQHTATTDHGSRNLCTYRPATPSTCPPTRSVLTERSVKAHSLDCAGWIGLTTPAALLRSSDAMARLIVINFPVRNWHRITDSHSCRLASSTVRGAHTGTRDVEVSSRGS